MSIHNYQTQLMLAAMDALNGDSGKFAQLMRRKADTTGINEWDQVTEKDFGFCFDYILERHGNRTVIDPTSRAAQQWLYRFMPADAPRWGKLGYVVESDKLGKITDKMYKANLLSEEEYVYSMNAEERDRMAGEGQ